MANEADADWTDEDRRTVRSDEGQRILAECEAADRRPPIGSASMRVMLTLFRLGLIGPKGTTKAGLAQLH